MDVWRGRDDNGRILSEWDPARTPLYTSGAFIYGGVSAHLHSRNRDRFPDDVVLAVPKIDPSDELFLPAISRFGYLQEDRAFEARRNHYWDQRTRIEQMIRCVEFDFADQREAILGDCPSVPLAARRTGNNHLMTLPVLSSLGIRRDGPAYTMSSIDIDRAVYDRGFANTIVVTGEANNIRDLALYWNLRATRVLSAQNPWPLWIPVSQLVTDEGKDIVSRAFGMAAYFGGVPLQEHEYQLYILSASLRDEDLRGQLASLYPKAQFCSSQLEPFYRQPAFGYITSDAREVHFNDGSGRVPIPRPQSLDHFAPFDRVFFDVKFGTARMPRPKSLLGDWRLHPNSLTTRITTSGAFSDFSNGTDSRHWTTLLPLTVPSGWQVLTDYFNSKGFGVHISDKARSAISVAKLFLNGTERMLLSSSLIHELLRWMSVAHEPASDSSPSRLYFAGRKAVTFPEIKKRLIGVDQATVKRVVERLVNAGILLRGASIKCPACQLSLWYPLGQINETWKCAGCHAEHPIPLGAQSTSWSYRVNELIAYGFDQGSIAPISAMTMLDLDCALNGRSLLGYYPGVTMSQMADSQTRVRAAEIDLVAFIDGNITIVECKEAGAANVLDDNEVRKVLDVGQDLNAERVIFATTGRFPQTLKESHEDSSPPLQWWERYQLLDCRGGLPAEQDDEVISSRATDYLRDLMNESDVT